MGFTFVSAGWPYLYEIPGLHNCIPMLFADSVARYRRHRGDDVLFTSGADEHGARVEFVAESQGRSPRDLVDEKVSATLPLLSRLGLSLDAFGRTSDPKHEVFVRRFVSRLLEVGALERRITRVPHCPSCRKFLPDRFVEGRCPRCGAKAFGNQCNNKRRCSAVLDPFDLVDARCAVCGGSFEPRDREHLYLSFAPLRPRLKRHIEESYSEAPAVREQALTVLEETEGMFLTRDTVWGVPLPEEIGLTGRTVYSWVDSLLGKLSTVCNGDAKSLVWRSPGVEKLFFLGMDGVGFYAVLLPALLMAADEDYSLDRFRIVTNDLLLYEGGVCSKSSRTGIWLPEALELLPPDYWRFVIFDAEARAAEATRPGASDLDFRWDSFALRANERLGALGGVIDALAGNRPSTPGDPSELRPVHEAFDTLLPGVAFGRLIDTIVQSGTRRADLVAAALPLLSCFLPQAAERAAAILTGLEKPPLFPELPLDGVTLRRRYAGNEARRRRTVDLHTELTDLRADSLCICPVRLDEG
ncbi:MAG: class I tRNA ligase family protein [Planctomycetes bacterium]|nr:class I tRNA ligase family protein [Planctomycetota bacterium]